ncbi:uncharacterized protein [Clytia hemisphaerica]|uniref:Uncharacterized protein n=1 Tax=Clytia hemisphaerica TaxID=252671 RepID=A0A7M6DQJ3_9CNID|eukprot:TCONS_00073453-protein
MASDNVSKTMKIISTVSLGHLAGITAFKSSCIQPALEEQEDVPAAAKTMSCILKRSSVLPIVSIVSSASSLYVYYKSYGTKSEDEFYLISSLMIGGLVPYTAWMLLPINQHFLSEGETFEHSDEKWKFLMKDWKKWHLPRSVVCASLFSMAVYKLVF